MGQRTYPKIGKKTYESWLDLLDKYKLKHHEGTSAHVEWDSYCLYKKLPEVTVMIKDEEGNFVEDGEEINEDIIENLNEIDEVIEESSKKYEGTVKITKRQREFTWIRDIGDSKSGKCYVCNRTITDDNFEAGHVISKYNGGDDNVKNLRAVCIPCNRSMGTRNLEEFKKDFESMNEYTSKGNRIETISSEITNLDVINILEKYRDETIYAKYFEKAIELIKNR